MASARSAASLVGATPSAQIRPVSLAVRRYLLRHRPAGIVVAVSGGADSMALAVCTLDLASRAGIPAACITVDHKVRPESADEAASVVALMRELGAPRAEVASGEIIKGEGPEGGARELRYRLLAKAAADLSREESADTVDVLLGHTLDDQAETVLLGLARGASAASLGAMMERRELAAGVFAGRPLLGVRRAETVACCHALGIAVVEDPSNEAQGPWRAADGTPLRRAAVRESALPALTLALGQDVVPALGRAAQQMQEDDEALARWAEKVLKDSSSAVGWRVETFFEVPTAVRKRALKSLLLKAGVPGGALTAVHLAAVDALITRWHGQGPVDLPTGVRIARRARELVLV